MFLELRLNEPVTLFTKRGDAVLYYDITAREQGLEMSEEYKTATECRLAKELAQTKLLLESLKTQNEIVCKLLEDVQNKWFESRDQLEQERAKNDKLKEQERLRLLTVFLNDVQPKLAHALQANCYSYINQMFLVEGTNIGHSLEEVESERN